MKTIQYVENGKGGLEPVEVKSVNGLSLLNANGDVNSVATATKYATDTMTFIKAERIKQSFYEVPPANFMPVRVGLGNYNDTIVTNLAYSNPGLFAASVGQNGTENRFTSAEVSLSKKTQQVRSWKSQITWDLMEIQTALQSNNWDIVVAKEEARKKQYDLGIQEVAFVGLVGDTSVTGLLNNADATINTTRITAPISGLNAANLQTFVSNLINDYYSAIDLVTMPTDFVIPVSDYLALCGQMVPGTVGTYPVNLLTYLEDAFKRQTQNPNFKISPVAYCEASKNTAAGINKQCYVLYKKDPQVMQLEIPVQYTTTAPNSFNNYSFQDVAYSRFTGLGLFNNRAMLYFQY